MNTDTIESERLIMRRFIKEDATAYLPLVSLSAVLRFTGEKALSTTDEVLQLLEARQLRDYEIHGYGRMACIEKATGQLIGFSGLKYLDGIDQTDVGYRFLPAVWGKGYATESAAAIIGIQVKQFGLKRIIGLIEPENLGSVRVLRKLGFSYERRFAAEGHGELDLYAIRFGCGT